MIKLIKAYTTFIVLMVPTMLIEQWIYGYNVPFWKTIIFSVIASIPFCLIAIRVSCSHGIPGLITIEDIRENHDTQRLIESVSLFLIATVYFKHINS